MWGCNPNPNRLPDGAQTYLLLERGRGGERAHPEEVLRELLHEGGRQRRHEVLHLQLVVPAGFFVCVWISWCVWWVGAQDTKSKTQCAQNRFHASMHPSIHPSMHAYTHVRTGSSSCPSAPRAPCRPAPSSRPAPTVVVGGWLPSALLVRFMHVHTRPCPLSPHATQPSNVPGWWGR